MCNLDFEAWWENAWTHIEFTFSFCDGLCISLEIQGGTFHVAAGGPGAGIGGTLTQGNFTGIAINSGGVSLGGGVVDGLFMYTIFLIDLAPGEGEPVFTGPSNPLPTLDGISCQITFGFFC